MEESLTLTQWKRFIEGFSPESPLREVILESWGRSLRAGVHPDPEKPTFRRVPDEELQRRLQSDQELIEIARPHLEWTATLLAPIGHVAYLVDREGIVLFVTGNAPQLMQDFGLLPGYDWSERTMGTNGAGTALVTGKPVAVIGPEHFSRPFHDCTCTGAPIHEPDGRVIGAIDISTSAADGNPERLKIVTHLAFVIEQEIAFDRQNKDLVRQLVEQNEKLAEMNRQLQADLASREQMELALREHEDRLQRTMTAARLGTWEWDWEIPNNSVTYSDNLGPLFGLPPGTYHPTYEAFLNSVHPQDRERVARAVTAAVEQDVEYGLEFRVVWPDGTIRWLGDKGKVHRDDTGRPVRMVGIAMDITERKRAEEALQYRARQQALILRSVPMAIYRADPTGTSAKTWVSENMPRVSGFATHQFLSNTGFWASRLHPDDHDRVIEEFRAIIERGTVTSEYRWQCADDSYHWFLDHATLIQDELGQPKEMIGTWLDITERIRAEGSLKLFRALLDQANDAIEVIDPATGRFVDCNEKACSSLGYTREEFLSLAVPDIDPIVTLPVFTQYMTQFREVPEGGAVTLETVHRRKDGSTFPVEVSCRLIRLDREYTLAIVRDITDRKQAEEAMRESEERFSLIMEHANDAIFYLDLHGGIQWVSSKAEFLTGYTAKDLVGRSFLELLTPETAKQGEVRLAAIRRGEQVPPLVEFEFIRHDGITLWVEANITSVTSRAERGRVVGRLVVAREITERKSAEAEHRQLFEKVQKSQDRLRAVSRRLIEVQEEERRSLARELHDQTGQSLTSLLLGLRSLRKMPTLKEAQARASELRKVTVEALEGVKRLAKGLRPSALDDLGLEAALRHLTEEFALASGLQVDLHVHGVDSAHLSLQVELTVYRIAQEALTNVTKHARAKTVSVIINASTSDLSLIIEDNGRGFDTGATSLPDKATTHLGLHGMQERAALLNGDVQIESKPGQGTTVYAKIPLGAGAEA